MDAQNWYEHNQERSIENDKGTVLGDSQITTDRYIPCNKSDIVIKEKDEDRCLVIDVSISSDYNIQKKVTEKISKYVDLHIECQNVEKES